MEQPPAFVELFHYNRWANQQVLLACELLSEAELDRAVPGAYGTVRDILEHIVRSEGGYLRQLTGTRPQPSFRWEDRPSVTAMAAYAAEVGEALIEAARSIDPLHLVGSNWNGQATTFHALAVFIQIVNHGIEHRTNITTLLNQGLGEPPAVDGWGYLTAHPERFGYALHGSVE